MRIFALVLGCALAAGAASNDSFLIRDADVYPVTGPELKGVSLLVLDGKIAGIGAKIAAPKGVRVIEGKGLRVYPGMIDSATELGLAEVPSVRETVDTGELGEFMPQLRAVSAVNPASERFPVVKVNGITTVMTFPAPANSDRRTAERQYIAGQGALINTDGWTWEEMALRPAAAGAVCSVECPSNTPKQCGNFRLKVARDSCAMHASLARS
jgi:imidazolonepropionase-like amidohydrolase